MDSKKTRLAVISTYPFKKSGLSQYTKDLIKSAIFRKSFQQIHTFSVAIKTGHDEIADNIDFTDISSLISTARILNEAYDAVHIQFDEYYFYNSQLIELNYSNFYTFLTSLKIPTLVTLHFGFRENKFLSALLRKILNLPHVHVTVHSESHMKYIQKISKNSNKVHLIHHGFPDNLRKFSDNEMIRYKNFRTKNKGFVVLMTLGYFGEWKNQLRMITLISFLIKRGLPLKYYVIGSNMYDKNYYQRCKQEIISQKMNDYIILKNIFLSSKKFNFYLKCADIYVAPHQNYHNTNPSGTITYALGAGLPLIASVTSFSSSPEIKKSILLANNDTQFLKKIIFLVSNPKKRRLMSEMAIHTTANWAWSSISRRYFDLLYSMIRQKGAVQKTDKTRLIYPFTKDTALIQKMKIIHNANELIVLIPLFKLPCISLMHSEICKKINHSFQLLQIEIYIWIQITWNKLLL